jgi:arylsulfatase A
MARICVVDDTPKWRFSSLSKAISGVEIASRFQCPPGDPSHRARGCVGPVELARAQSSTTEADALLGNTGQTADEQHEQVLHEEFRRIHVLRQSEVDVRSPRLQPLPGDATVEHERTSMKHVRALAIIAGLVSMFGGPPQAQQGPGQAPRPNIVVFLTDDQGYGDLSLTGHPTIRTPNVDRLAREGIQLRSFYGAPNCTPSRGMFMTGRYPPRTGLLSPTGPGHPSGIQASEITLPEALKSRGYRTAMFGKWHLGDFATEPRFNPTAHGFDVFLGIPYSHDYNPPEGVPLFRGTTLEERPVAYQTMTKRFTQEAVRFIRASAGQPFFIWMAHPMPHVPIGTSEEFRGRSRAGRYGDVVEELDWSVGEVQKTLTEMKLDRNTIIVYMSDNGPWVSVGERLYDRKERGTKELGDVGWAGLLRGAKQSTWEGGVRVPAVVRWPAMIPGGRISADMVSTMDLYTTFVRAAGAAVPSDRPVDGVDILPLLRGTGPAPRSEFFYFAGANLQGVREGAWKLRVAADASADGSRQGGRGRGRGDAGGVAGVGGEAPSTAGGAAGAQGPDTARATAVGEPELFNLENDPSERFNVAATHGEVVARLRARMESMLKEIARPATATSR